MTEDEYANLSIFISNKLQFSTQSSTSKLDIFLKLEEKFHVSSSVSPRDCADRGSAM